MGLHGFTETTRARRETATTKEVWTDGTEGLQKLIEYTTTNIGLRVEDQELITRKYKEKNTNEQER
jgi:hypothetical protein